MNKKSLKGFTLVEVMVGLTVGLLLLGMISSIYVSSKTIFGTQDQTSRLQEAARFGMDMLEQDIRMAGFNGCRGARTINTTTNTKITLPPDVTLNTASYPIANGLLGYSAGTSTWTPGLPGSISGLTPPPTTVPRASDVITLWLGEPHSYPLVADMTSDTDVVTLPAPAIVTAGDIAVISDCNQSTFFEVTANATGVLSHAVGGATVGNSTASFKGPVSAGVYKMPTASLNRIFARTYYVAPSIVNPAVNALWVFDQPSYSGASPQELIVGVEDVHYLFGVDTNGDGSADNYVAASTSPNWPQVVSVQIQLIMSTQATNTTAQPTSFSYTPIGTTTPILITADGRIRQQLNTVVTLRNRVK